MKGIWDTFEIPEIANVAKFFTCGGGESGEISSDGINPPKTESKRPKRRSLYLPGNEEGSVKSKAIVSIEENLILNRYAPKSRSIIGQPILEEEESACRDDTTEAPLNNSNSSRAQITSEHDTDSYIQSTSRPFGHDRSLKQGAIIHEPNYGNIIVVVRRDVKNNTIAINFEEKPT